MSVSFCSIFIFCPVQWKSSGLLSSFLHVAWPRFRRMNRVILVWNIFQKFKTRLDAQNSKLEEINTVAARIQRTPGGLSEEVVRSVAHLNKQKQSYSNQADERLAQLEVALEDVGSSNKQHFLASTYRKLRHGSLVRFTLSSLELHFVLLASVDEPWERRVSTNKVPYYIK